MRSQGSDGLRILIQLCYNAENEEGGMGVDPIYWLIGLGFFVVLEIITLGLTSIWFAGGCLLAFLAALAGGPFWLQAVLALAASIVLLVFTKPVAEKYLNNSRTQTNIDSVRGRQGKVTADIDNFNQRGTVMLDGMEWTARNASSDELIPAGTRVVVQDVQGAHLEVVKAENDD